MPLDLTQATDDELFEEIRKREFQDADWNQDNALAVIIAAGDEPLDEMNDAQLAAVAQDFLNQATALVARKSVASNGFDRLGVLWKLLGRKIVDRHMASFLEDDANLNAWPNDEWVQALDDLSIAWHAGEVAGYLFNGSKMSNTWDIMNDGFFASNSYVFSGEGAGYEEFETAVHLATPDVAAWYMQDTAVMSEARPCLVAVDFEAYIAATATRVYVDGWASDCPVLTALGAPTEEAVSKMMGRHPTWERGLSVTGSIGLAVDSIQPEFLKIISTPDQLKAFITEAAARPRDGFIQRKLMEASADHPWRSQGWRFSAAELRTPFEDEAYTPPVP